MKINRIEQSFKDCESLPSEIRSEIEYLLTKAILIDICIQFNQKIKQIIKNKLSIIQDESIKVFTFSYVDQQFRYRNPKYKDIKDTLKKFGHSYEEKFDEEIKKLDQYERVINNYSSLFENRNKAAHSEVINASLNDVKQYYDQAHLVLDCLQRALTTNE